MVSLASPAVHNGLMPPPHTPLPRRPALGSKRSRSQMDNDSSPGDMDLMSKQKKLKVAFSPTVNVRLIDEWDEKSYDLVREEVKSSIDRHVAVGVAHDDTQYMQLLHLLGADVRHDEPAPSGSLLKKYLIAIDSKVSRLGDCNKLAMAVLNIAWLGRDDAFVALYIKFICSLATTHSKFVPSIMDRLVGHFVFLPSRLGRCPGEEPVSKSSMLARIHLAIKTILSQVPSANSALLKSLEFAYPEDDDSTRTYLQYQKQLLRIVEATPELKASIVAMITQHVVDIDVQVQQDLDEFEDEVEDQLLRSAHKRRSRQDADESDSESVSDSDSSDTEEQRKMKDIRRKVAAMDGTLDLLFDFYAPLLQTGLRADLNEGYQQLLSHFKTLIMPNRTRHAQFLLFHFSQTTSDHVRVFATHCLQIVMSSGSVSERMTACAYLASFIARGAHIPGESVRDVFEVLCNFLEETRMRYEPNCRGPDRRAYGQYYAVAQAMLYIFCFRWRDLVTGSASPEPGDESLSEDDVLAEGRDLAWFAGARETLQKNIYSILNPLKVCSPIIVTEFAKIAHHLRFMYVFPKLETNKRVRLGHTASMYSRSGLIDIGRRETALDHKSGESHWQLEAYFPFDPYHLPTSKRWVEGDYNEWKLPQGMRQAEDDEDDEDEDEDDDEVDGGDSSDEGEDEDEDGDEDDEGEA